MKKKKKAMREVNSQGFSVHLYFTLNELKNILTLERDSSNLLKWGFLKRVMKIKIPSCRCILCLYGVFKNVFVMLVNFPSIIIQKH